MAERETVVIDVKLDAEGVAEELKDMMDQLAALKDKEQQLDALRKSGSITWAEYKTRVEAVKAEMRYTQNEIKGLNAQTRLLDTTTAKYSDSLNGQRQKLRDMQAAYASLSAEQREGEGGKAFLEQIQAQDAAVKELEASLGVHRLNVGNYPKLLTAIVPGLDKVIAGMDGLQGQLTAFGKDGVKVFTGLGQSVKAFGKLFLTPPIAIIAAVLAGIYAVVKVLKAGAERLAEAFKKNDDAGTALASAMAALRPIGTAVSKIFDGLAVVLGNLLEGFSKVAIGIISLGERLHILPEGYAEAARQAQNLVHAQDELEETERRYTVNSAKRAKEVSALRAQAAEEQDPARRKRLLEQAIELEEQDLADRRRIAAEKLRILEQTAEQEVDTSDETKNKIAQARADMYKAEQDFFDGTRRLRSQLTAADKEETARQEAEAKKRAEAWKRRQEERRALAEKQAQNEKDIAQQAEDLALSLIKDETERAIASRRIEGLREIEKLKERYKNEKELTAEAKATLNQLIIDKQKALDNELNQMATDAADAKTEAEMEAERQKARALLDLRLELAEEGSAKWLEAQDNLLNTQMEAELAAYEYTEQEKALIKERYDNQRIKAEEAIRERLRKEAVKEKTDQVEMYKAIGVAAGELFGSLSELLTEWGNNSEQAAAASKAFGLISVLINEATCAAETASAIIKAIDAAMTAAAATGPAAPFTAPAFIAEMVGIVSAAVASHIGNIVQAYQILKKADSVSTDGGNYATGGIVGGTSYTGDKVTAHVNSREGIFTVAQQKNLFDFVNSSVNFADPYVGLAAQLAEAVGNLPAPVMDYREFRQFGDRVATYEEIARI